MASTLISTHSSQLIIKKTDPSLQFIKSSPTAIISSQDIIFLNLFLLPFILFFLNSQNHQLINDLILHYDYYFLFVLLFFDFGKHNQKCLLTVFCLLY